MRVEKYNLRRSTEDAAASGKGAIAAAGEENVDCRFRINEECLVVNLFLYRIDLPRENTGFILKSKID
jgi:hypothetical protein